MGIRARLRVTHLLILRSLTLNSMKNCTIFETTRKHFGFIFSWCKLLILLVYGTSKIYTLPR